MAFNCFCFVFLLSDLLDSDLLDPVGVLLLRHYYLCSRLQYRYFNFEWLKKRKSIYIVGAIFGAICSVFTRFFLSRLFFYVQRVPTFLCVHFYTYVFRCSPPFVHLGGGYVEVA